MKECAASTDTVRYWGLRLEGHPIAKWKGFDQVPEISTVQVNHREVELATIFVFTDLYPR